MCFSTKIYLILASLGLLNYKIYIWNLQDPLDSREKRKCLQISQSLHFSKPDGFEDGQLLISLEDLLVQESGPAEL